MKFERAFLVGFNFLARLFGVLCVIVGIVFLISAYAMKENRALDAVAGVCIIAMGVAFLLAKSVRTEQIARMRRLMGRDE
jgi:cytochrome c biogenesis protein CcdA